MPPPYFRPDQSVLGVRSSRIFLHWLFLYPAAFPVSADKGKLLVSGHFLNLPLHRLLSDGIPFGLIHFLQERYFRNGPADFHSPLFFLLFFLFPRCLWCCRTVTEIHLFSGGDPFMLTLSLFFFDLLGTSMLMIPLVSRLVPAAPRPAFLFLFRKPRSPKASLQMHVEKLTTQDRDPSAR